MQLRSFLAALVLAGSALAACSGNFGAGSNAPGGIIPSGPLGGVNASPSPTPNAASGIVTYGESNAFQPLPSAAGYGGAIAFPVPSPKPSGFEAIPVGVTLAVVSPTDAPDLNVQTAGKKPKKRERPARSLVYVSLLATRDITLDAYPRIAIDVPRDIVTTYRETELGLALYNAGDKDRTYKLAIAERDAASPPPTPSARPSAPPAPTSSASSTPSGPPTGPPTGVPSGFPTGLLTSPPGGPNAARPLPSVSPTLPPQRIIYAGTAAPLKLTANRVAVFALYALPVSTPSPTPSAKAPASAGSGSPAAPASGSPAASPSAGPSSSPAATSSGSPAAAVSSTTPLRSPAPSST